MKSSQTKIRVRYAETDQMGVVHHGNYAQYLEIARIEWLEQFGVSYKSMEEDGVMLPVYEMNFKYKRPAHFDEQLIVETKLEEKPDVRIKFTYKIYRGAELLTIAKTTLVFMDAETKKPISCPNHILKAIGF